MDFCPASPDTARCEKNLIIRNAREHKVQKTDTIAGLALKYNTTIYEIKVANGLRSDLAMHARESLTIPHPGQVVLVGSPFKQMTKKQSEIHSSPASDFNPIAMFGCKLPQHQKLAQRSHGSCELGDIELIGTSVCSS